MASRGQPLAGTTVKEMHVSSGHVFARRLPPGLTLESHTHEFSLLTVVTAGAFAEAVGRHDDLCIPGDVRLLPAGDAHTNAVGVPSACLQIELSPRLMACFAQETGGLAAAGRLHGELVPVLGSRLIQECDEHDGGADGALDAIVCDLLSYAGRRRVAASRRRPSWLRRVEERIHDSFVDGVSLAELAETADVHPVHVAREFHRCCGCTVGDLVRRLRLQRACELMRNPRLSLGAIAAEAGFSDQSHFVSQFRRYLGTTPHRFRQRLIGGVHRASPFGRHR